MVMECEIRRAHNTCLALCEGRCNSPRRSRSKSPPSRFRRTSAHHTPEDTVIPKKFETPSGKMPLFKGCKGTQIYPKELHKIGANIHRNMLGIIATNELKRDIPNKDDVVLKRTAGEGSMPIFDREEIKREIGETEEVEEHLSEVTVNVENPENQLSRNSASLNPTRTRNHSPRRAWSRHPRFVPGFYTEETDHSRERKEGERSYRDYREWPRNHSRDRRQTDRSRERYRLTEQRVPREHYIQPIPIPVYYGNFQPGPLMVQP